MANPNTPQIEKDYARSKVDSYNSWDVQYVYTHDWANSSMGSSTFTVGVIDATDADIPLYRRIFQRLSVRRSRSTLVRKAVAVLNQNIG